ncbi:MAG: nitronate monooxygenase [Parasphingorhabdus sp.]|jgi:nitronate monooxygenase
MIKTRLTERFNLDHPIIQAPMALAAGGALASSISRAGGLGLIGGAYGVSEWLTEQFDLAGSQQVGCGLITWSLAKQPELLELVLSRQPSALFLSFGDPAPFVQQIRDSNTPLICQVQTVKDARHAIEVGADVVVAQGAEAGGHGESRATMTLVPEVADLIAKKSSETLLCAAGGIADGRGLAAALMLGADGVLIGSRFWATAEALVHPNMLDAALEADGDVTIRSSVMDIARLLEWPKRYTARVLKNDFTGQWHHAQNELMQSQATEAARWKQAWVEGDVTTANTFVGEATGLINSIEPAADILQKISQQAEALLSRFPTPNSS